MRRESTFIVLSQVAPQDLKSCPGITGQDFFCSKTCKASAQRPAEQHKLAQFESAAAGKGII